MSAKTRVLFRADRRGIHVGSVTAVFPDEPYAHGLVMCYASVGQHGACSLMWVREDTRAATPAEYASLARELESIGYTLKIGRKL